jgi:hypothetical protein
MGISLQSMADIVYLDILNTTPVFDGKKAMWIEWSMTMGFFIGLLAPELADFMRKSGRVKISSANGTRTRGETGARRTMFESAVGLDGAACAAMLAIIRPAKVRRWL